MARPWGPALTAAFVLSAASVCSAVYVHTGDVEVLTTPCYNASIGASNSTEVLWASSWGAGTCDPASGAGRLGRSFWCPSTPNPYEYLQVSFADGATKIAGIYISGTVTEFTIATALNDIDQQYVMYKERDRVRVFREAQHQSETAVRFHSFDETIVKHVRIYPLKWTGATIKLQLDLLRCVACGDGFWDATEECDDGNMIDGDGCSGVNAKVLGYAGPCSKETKLGQFWCEPRTEGPNRGNDLNDCLYRRNTGNEGRRAVGPPQKRHYAEKHYADRDYLTTGGYNSGILAVCDGNNPCDGQNPLG